MGPQSLYISGPRASGLGAGGRLSPGPKPSPGNFSPFQAFPGSWSFPLGPGVEEQRTPSACNVYVMYS